MSLKCPYRSPCQNGMGNIEAPEWSSCLFEIKKMYFLLISPPAVFLFGIYIILKFSKNMHHFIRNCNLQFFLTP